MSEETEKRYGISKELADKIDREYDELFKNNPEKLGFKECGHTDLPSQLHKDIWNRAMDKAIEACNKYESYGAAYEIKTLKV